LLRPAVGRGGRISHIGAWTAPGRPRRQAVVSCWTTDLAWGLGRPRHRAPGDV